MSAPNIYVRTHEECCRQDYDFRGRRWHVLGDVRRCEHGKVQVLTRVHEHSSVQGPGTHWWRTLSPVWDFFEYRRAIRALEG